MTNPESPAFPLDPEQVKNRLEFDLRTPFYGLTKREWFAGMALMGTCANPDISQAAAHAGLDVDGRRACYADGAVAMADAIIAKLNESK